ncbi:MAG: formimidoylglutamase [Pseudomonadota bacterium]
MHILPDMKLWQGRLDTLEGEFGKRWHQIIQPFAAAEAHFEKGIALIGFACDTGVARNHGRLGACQGPSAIRHPLGNMPVLQCHSITDAGDVICEQKDSSDGLEEAQQELANIISTILHTGRLPIAIGGGHEIAYSSFCGLAQHVSKHALNPRIGVINLDAHFDLRVSERASSGTPFLQIAEYCKAQGWPFHYCCLGISRFANTQSLFHRAKTLGVVWRTDEEMTNMRLQLVLDTVQSFISQIDYLYLTVCLDVLPAAIAPGVSAPAARGVALEVIESVIDAITTSGKLLTVDIAELNPNYDIDQQTARVAARLVARIAEGWYTS